MNLKTVKKVLCSRIAKVGYALLVGLIIVISLFNKLFVTNDNGYSMVIQNPLTGDLTWHLTPGVKFKMFGKVTTYPQREQFWFSNKADQGNPADESLLVRFNDGGHAQISGSISIELPVDIDHLNLIHQKYGSQEALNKELAQAVLERSVYTAGPMLSSTESYAARRNELLHLIEDQIENGTYDTETIVQQVEDAGGQPRTVHSVRVKMVDGKPQHAIISPFKELGISTSNLSANDVKYDKEVEQQIQAQQAAVAAIQVSTAEAQQWEQDALTAEKQGLAKVATAKWAKEAERTKATVEAEKLKDVAVLKAKQGQDVAESAAKRDAAVLVLNAQRDLDVALLTVKTASARKDAIILKAQGEAKAKQLVMDADGALTIKLEAWTEAQKLYAKAVGSHKGNWAPGVVIGASSGGNNAPGAANGVQQLIDMLNVKTAQSLQPPK